MKIDATLSREMSDDERLGTAGSADPDRADDPLDVDADSPVDDGGILDLFDPGLSGLAQGELALALLARQEDMGESSALAEKLAYAASDYLSQHRDGSRKEGETKGLNRFTADDFEAGPQRQAFLLVDAMHKDLFGHKSTFESRQRAIEFIFCDESADDTFVVCCEVLGCRIDVLRLRFQYEFWLRWLTFAEPFQFAACPLPDIVQSQVMMCGGFEGIYVAQEAWHQPGIGTEALLLRASGGNSTPDVVQRFLHALYLMEERLLVSQNEGSWYFTGRNPTQARVDFARASGYFPQRGGSIYWSELFPTF